MLSKFYGQAWMKLKQTKVFSHNEVSNKHLGNLCNNVKKEENGKVDQLGGICAKDFRASIESQTDFSLGFSKEALQKRADGNAVFSPLSISVALSLVAGGTKGSTLDQFCSCLKFKDPHQLHDLSSHLTKVVLSDGSANGGPLLSFVNGVWVDKSMSLEPNYRDIVKKQYNTEPSSADFMNKADEVREEVNKWAENEIRWKIKELLPGGSVNGSTRLVLASALYFNGVWQKNFDLSATKEGTFNLLNGDRIKVPMMTTGNTQFITRVGDCKILCLPYSDGQDKRLFSMYFILPDNINGLPRLEKNFDLTFLQRHLSAGREVIVGNFQLPRFKISYSVQANDVLQNMGLLLPFSENANLSAMVDSFMGLRISDVFHKTFMEVNEEGTEAAAATAVSVSMCCTTSVGSAPMIHNFIADHPFMFVIKEEESGAILFVGHVLNRMES